MGQVYSLSPSPNSGTESEKEIENNKTIVEEVSEVVETVEQEDVDNQEEVDNLELVTRDLGNIEVEEVEEKESIEDQIIKEEVTKFVDALINRVINNRNKTQESESIFSLGNQSLISSLSDIDMELDSDSEIDIESISDSISDSDTIDDIRLELSDIEDIEIQVKMELLNSNKKIIQLKTENERLREEYDDLFFNFTRLKVKYESLVFKHKKD